MILKIYSLSPNQKTALLNLAEIEPEKFAMPVNDGKAKAFSFNIEDINQVAKTLAVSGSRPVDWTTLDISEELIEFDAVWLSSEDTIKVKKMSLQFEGHELITTDWTVDENDFEIILRRANFDTFEFCAKGGDNWEEHKNDLIPAIVAHYLTMPDET